MPLAQDTLNELYFTNFENLFDAEGAYKAPGSPVAVGDHFVGILRLQNIDAAGQTIWNFSNTDQITGIFAARVEAIFSTPDPYDPGQTEITHVVLGPPTITSFSHPNGDSFSTAGLLTGTEILVLFRDAGSAATPFESNGPMSQDIAVASDGNPWLTLTYAPGTDGSFGTPLAGPDDDGYFYTHSNFSVEVSNFKGSSWGGLNAVRNNTGYALAGVFDINEGEISGGTLLNDLVFSSELELNPQGSFLGSFSPWDYRSNDPAIILPTAPTAAIGDFVWEDLNANGIQEANEPGVAGVTVQLSDCAGTLVASTTTDADGFYLFSGLIPGDYYLVLVKPNGYFFTAQDQGNDAAVDSDADPLSGGTVCTTLDPGETDLTWDAGLYRPAQLGDRVWEDLNGNGIQDAGEPGFAGATVDLYACEGNLLATTTTDAEGWYLFTGLVPASYRVVFTAPHGYEFTLQDQGMDDALDSDANASGATACVTLISGESNLTVDAGLVEVIEAAAIGDFVWQDLNRNGVQDAGEPGIEGVLVELYDCQGNLVASTATGAGGYYLFSNLMPGNYNLKFYAPAGYLFTVQNAGGDPAKDSDADPATGETECTTLASGETDLTWDAGLWQAMPAIDIEKATNGEDADNPTGPFIPVGDPVLWTYVVTNTGNVPLVNVTVTDDQGVAVSCPKNTLDVGETMTCTANGTAMAGQYANTGNTTGDYGDTTVTDSDPSHYYGTMEAPGTGTPGYWKNHPEAWPVDEITVGGETYSKDMAIGLMGCPDGNKLFTMFRALVAAKLNVLVGNDASCIAGTIDAADAWIAEYGPMPTACRGDPKVKADSYAWTIGEPLYWLLDDYNNGLLCARRGIRWSRAAADSRRRGTRPPPRNTPGRGLEPLPGVLCANSRAGPPLGPRDQCSPTQLRVIRIALPCLQHVLPF